MGREERRKKLEKRGKKVSAQIKKEKKRAGRAADGKLAVVFSVRFIYLQDGKHTRAHTRTQTRGRAASTRGLKSVERRDGTTVSRAQCFTPPTHLPLRGLRGEERGSEGWARRGGERAEKNRKSGREGERERCTVEKKEEAADKEEEEEDTVEQRYVCVTSAVEENCLTVITRSLNDNLPPRAHPLLCLRLCPPSSHLFPLHFLGGQKKNHFATVAP